MPDLNSLLRDAADSIIPSPMPPFAAVQLRLRHRRLRRAGSVLGIVVLTAGVVGLAALTGGRRSTAPAASRPCVSHTAVNSYDTFVAVPQSGVTHLDIEVGSTLTVGWLGCGETGDFALSENDPKHLLLAEPNSGFVANARGVASARYQAFRSGTLTLTGRGSLGSDGVLEISIGPATEPPGASDPSPFPLGGIHEDIPLLCLSKGAVDDQGRVTETVAFETSILAPAPDVTSRFTAEDILQRFRNNRNTTSVQGTAQAVFGRLTDNTAPFPKARPLWVVVVCGGPLYMGSGGGMRPQPAPAPGTSPSPGGTYLEVVSVAYDENGAPLGESISNYADADLRASVLFEVPFERNRQDEMSDRQIGLSYRSDDSCSTFDHLDVQEPQGGSVYVRVWLRLIGDHKACAGSADAHDVVVGLRLPLAARPLVRGTPPR